MRRANGDGTIIKLSGNRRRPYAIRRVIGWREDGGRIIKYVSYHKTYREAEQALNRYNEDPYTISKITFEKLYMEWYAIREKTKKEQTLKGYRTCFNHCAPLYNLRMQEIDRLVLSRFYERLDVNKSTLHKVVQFLNMLFKYAVKLGILPISALKLNEAVNIPSKPEKRQNPRSAVTKQELETLWQLSYTNEYAKIILVYIYTGLRFSELKELQPENCHDNYVDIIDAKTPAGIRSVPLCDKVKKLLPIINVPARTTFERKYKELLPDHVIHDTRHTFITMLTEKNVDARIIKSIVGHKSNDITEVYTHISLEAKLEAVNLL